MSQRLDLKLKGIYTDPNNFSEVPVGALAVANNVVIDKDSVIESRRGQSFYGDVLSVGDGQINKLFNYRNRLLTHYNDKLAYDSDNEGTWVEYSGTFSEPDTGVKIASSEANSNFYFTTSKGIYKLDNIAASPVVAGAYKGLDGFGILAGAAGWFPTDNQVAYRVVWGYKDRNNNLILGAPSNRFIIINSSGGNRVVDLSFAIPAGVTTNWFYQIYRSGASGGDDIVPNDEMQLVIEDNPTSAQIIAKIVTVTDETPDDLKGATLYTSPSQEGIANANEPPPFAKDITVFKEFTLYANTKSKNRININLIAVGSGSFGYATDSAVDITNASPVVTSITSTTGLRVGMRVIAVGVPTDTYILSVDSATQVTLTKNSTATSAGITMEFQDRLSVGNVDYFGGSTSNVSLNQFLVDLSGTPAENIAETSLNFIEVLNQSTSNTLLYAYYLSGYEDLPGQILIEERQIGGDTYYLSSTYGDSFSPTLPERQAITAISQADPTVITSASHGLTTGDSVTIYQTNSTPALLGVYEVTVLTGNTFTVPVEVTTAGTSGYFTPTQLTVSSDNEVKINRIYISKNKQPEAVPLFSYLEAGSADAPIYRIIALRDSAFIFKEDGIFRITGENLASFRVSLLDNTSTIKAPETAVAFNNQVFMFSDQGVVGVSDSGVAVLSRPIESTLLELSSSQYTNFSTASFGISYESSRQYILFTVTNTADTYATQAFVYNSFTNSWTRWPLSRTYGLVSKRDNKLYSGHPTNHYVYKERKAYTLEDYADEEYPVTITAVDDLEITLASLDNVVVGRTLGQGNKRVIIEEIDIPTKTLTVSAELPFTVGDALVFTPIDTRIQWLPITSDNPGILKQFREITLLFRDAAFSSASVDFSTNFTTNPVSVDIIPKTIGPWGSFPYGGIAWGGGVGGQQALRTFVPLEKQRAHWLNLGVTSSQAFTRFSLTGLSLIFNAMTERFK